MNLERFTLIVESYGADSQQWPSNERAEALEFSSTSIDAVSLIDQERELDQHLALFEFPNSERSVRRIKMGIFSALKLRRLEQLLNWVLPDFDDLTRTLWRPTLLGVVIGLTLSNDTYELSPEEELSVLAFTYTLSEEWNNE